MSIKHTPPGPWRVNGEYIVAHDVDDMVHYYKLGYTLYTDSLMAHFGEHVTLDSDHYTARFAESLLLYGCEPQPVIREPGFNC